PRGSGKVWRQRQGLEVVARPGGGQRFWRQREGLEVARRSGGSEKVWRRRESPEAVTRSGGGSREDASRATRWKRRRKVVAEKLEEGRWQEGAHPRSHVRETGFRSSRTIQVKFQTRIHVKHVKITLILRIVSKSSKI